MAKSKVEKKAKVVEVVDTHEVIHESPKPLNLVGEQTVIGAKNSTLKEGKEYKVTAEIAMILINKGFAFIKK